LGRHDAGLVDAMNKINAEHLVVLVFVKADSIPRITTQPNTGLGRYDNGLVDADSIPGITTQWNTGFGLYDTGLVDAGSTGKC
jgi:hypothetical protein